MLNTCIQSSKIRENEPKNKSTNLKFGKFPLENPLHKSVSCVPPYEFIGPEPFKGLLISSPDKKNEKTNDFGSMLGVFLGRFGGYLGVFGGGFWREFGGVFRKFLRVI